MDMSIHENHDELLSQSQQPPSIIQARLQKAALLLAALLMLGSAVFILRLVSVNPNGFPGGSWLAYLLPAYLAAGGVCLAAYVFQWVVLGRLAMLSMIAMLVALFFRLAFGPGTPLCATHMLGLSLLNDVPGLEEAACRGSALAIGVLAALSPLLILHASVAAWLRGKVAEMPWPTTTIPLLIVAWVVVCTMLFKLFL
jgi:hypothetical protein